MMTVRQLLNRKGNSVMTIAPDATVFQALTEMATAGIGALVVMEDGRLIGIISERDYARKVILKGRISRETAVHEIMSSPAITVNPKQTLNDCMEMMTNERVRHLPVVDAGELVGIISIGDVVKEIISQQAFMIEQLESYIDRR